MAIPAIFSTVASGLSSMGSGGGAQKSQMGYGLGANILGAPGDPAGFIYNIALNKKARDEEQRRYEEQQAQQKNATELAKKQMAVENEMANRNTNLGAMDWMAKRRDYAVGGFNKANYQADLLRASQGVV
jgi:hypothetical protein